MYSRRAYEKEFMRENIWKNIIKLQRSENL